jgi:hypothetical protein
MSDYRWGLGWLLDILTTYSLTTRGHALQITDTHTHTQTSVLGPLQSPLAVSWQRILTQGL